jgi:23S rRNA (guanosine2251-2'-O)-methyltransferase
MKQLKPKVLRKSEPTEKDIKKIKRNPIYLILDRIVDTYNIGSLFRLADAIAVTKMYLCGDMEYPPASRIHKAAVGTEKWVPWEKKDSTLDIIKKLKDKGVQIIAVEQSPKSVSYKNIAIKVKFPCAIICGNETYGVSEEILKKADIITELPMYGINNSFNVWGSTAIIAYKALESL